MTGSHDQTMAHIAGLEARVDGVEKGMRSLAESIQALGVKMDARATTQWTPIWSAAGVAVSFLGVLGTALYLPMLNNVARAELQIERVRDAVVTRGEYDARSASEVQRREATFAALRDTNTRQDAEQERTRERIERRLDRIEERQMRP